MNCLNWLSLLFKMVQFVEIKNYFYINSHILTGFLDYVQFITYKIQLKKNQPIIIYPAI